MTMLAVLPLPGTTDPHEGRILWFSADGCVHWSGENSSAEVFVAGTLIGRFTPRERGARNVLLLGLSDDPNMHLGHLARAFHVSDESLRLMRLQRENEGLAAVVARAPGGKEQKVRGDALQAVERLFARGATLREVQVALAKRKTKAAIGTLFALRTKWRARQASARQAETAIEAHVASSASCEPTPAIANAPEEAKGSKQTVSEQAVRSGRFVQAVGTWLLIGVVNALGLYRAVERERTRAERKGRRLRSGTVRVAVDALIAALAVGQKCVEGVRRLQTATAGVLVRAAEAPSASWVRRVLGNLAGEGGAAFVGLGMAGTHIRAAQEASAAGQPTVFYVDNHMRRYTGQEVVRKGWRMQDKRAVPGCSDCYVHDEDGRALFRIDAPMHDSLTSLLGRVTTLLRAALGPDERILVAFDRAGAFAEQMAELRDEGFEFVTYERRPYALVAANTLGETLELEDGEVLRYAELGQKNLGGGRGRVRRIVVQDQEGRQINLVATSKESAAWLIQVMRGRWNQENGFKHAVERWGQNQLDGRTVVSYPPETVIPNPARRRLDHALRIARTREGDARRLLARMRPVDGNREKVERDLADAVAQQEELEAQRPHVPEHDQLCNTELAGKLVHHVAEYKLLLDTIRTACANAESELASTLARTMRRPREAKKLLANLLAAPGHVTVSNYEIRVTLLCAANASERKSIDAFLRHVTTQRLTLPGDVAARPLAFRSQESIV
jgi:hypothetical protein